MAKKLRPNDEKALREAEYFAAQTARENVLTEIHKLELARAQRETENRLAENSNNRVLDFTNAVTQFSSEQAIEILHRWGRLSKDPITIRFSSPGGSVVDGLALYDTIMAVRGQGIRITTYALGWAASMAAVLLQAGEERIIGANAYILIHEISSGAIGKLSELEDETKFCRKINDRLFNILSERAKIKRATIINRAKRKDWWLDSEDCLKYGFADKRG